MRTLLKSLVFATGIAAFAGATPSHADYPLFQPLAPASTNQPAAPAWLQSSAWLPELLKLNESGAEESLLLAFVSNTEGTFNLTAEQIIYLRDTGLPQTVISAMLQHDQDIASGLRPLVATTVPHRSLLALSTVKTVGTPAKKPAADPESSIIVREEWETGEARLLTAEEAVETAVGEAGTRCEKALYRVRKPHPVRLTDPIVVFRTSPVTPNLVVIRPLR